MKTSSRSGQQRAFCELLTLLAGSQGAVRAAGMLMDRSPDAGLFGPDSVTWRLMREPRLLASGSRALLMQLAHPLVAQGVADHSRFERDAFGRLLATVRWVATTVFGTTAEASGAADGLRRVHERVAGCLEPQNATAGFAPAAPYNALDPTLGLWVHATLVDSLLASYEALIGPLDPDDADRCVVEWNAVATLLGVLSERPWRGRGDLAGYVDRQISAGIVRPVPAAVCAARTVLAPPLPWPGLAPVARAVALLTAGSLDPRLRAGYGLAWSAERQALYLGICAASRGLTPVLPRRLRVSPLYDLARSRLH